MLNKKEKDLCNYLKKMSDWVTSAELAVFCTCSTRTIRNRVAKLNQSHLSLDKLNGLVQEVLSAHHMQLNQYVLENISLHLAISMARIKQGHTLMSCPKHELLKRKSTFKIAEEIADKLAQEYDIQFSEIELAQLSLLFIGLQNDPQHHLQNDALTCLIDTEIIQALETVLAEVERTYLVDLHDTAFFNQLAIHLQSLYHRSRYDTFTRNNSLMDLKSAYPLTYDLAVYIASLIQEQLSIKINDDEIAFIALHIGAYLENERYDKNRISLHLFVNDYHDIGKKMREKLMRYFGKRVTVDVIEKTDLAPLSSELLITTDQAIASTYEHAVKVQPFLRAKDLKKIAQAIDTLIKIGRAHV